MRTEEVAAARPVAKAAEAATGRRVAVELTATAGMGVVAVREGTRLLATEETAAKGEIARTLRFHGRVGTEVTVAMVVRPSVVMVVPVDTVRRVHPVVLAVRLDWGVPPLLELAVAVALEVPVCRPEPLVRRV